MFNKEIHSITLANDIADRLFDNISAQNYAADQSFTATLRAILHKRLPGGESVRLALVPIFRTPISPEIIRQKLDGQGWGTGCNIRIVYAQDPSRGTQLLEAVQDGFEGYEPQEDLRIFHIKKLNGLFYIGGSSCIIFLDSLDLRKYHALQMMIPKYLPKLFADAPLTAEEADLLKSLGLRNQSEYARLIEEFAQKLDMRTEMIKSRLRDFETVFERERIGQIEQEIQRYQGEYQSALTNLRNISSCIQLQQITLAGLQCRVNQDHDSELMEYFLCNKNISVIKVSGTSLEFVVHGYADVFDEEAFDTYAGNSNSFLYSSVSNPEGMAQLYRAIFSENLYKLRICAAYKADMKNTLTPVMGYNFPPESCHYLPNPHIQQYGCIGGYSQRFAEYMARRDYVGAIDQAAVSARNLNFHDSTVMTKFAKSLSSTNIRCIENAQGKLMTPKEAIKCLNQSESPQK